MFRNRRHYQNLNMQCPRKGHFLLVLLIQKRNWVHGVNTEVSALCEGLRGP